MIVIDVESSVVVVDVESSVAVVDVESSVVVVDVEFGVVAFVAGTITVLVTVRVWGSLTAAI